ncbi:MAG: hypothetical protein HXX20_06545 [Chloroflexi bacterium]|nr:hypothetical protein [Chloroflexota bacterium]
MAKQETPRKKTYRETDSVWKDLLNRYFPDFLLFFFPKTYQIIHWERDFEFLDTELPKLSPQSEGGKRLADKLVKVYRVQEEAEEVVTAHLKAQELKDDPYQLLDWIMVLPEDLELVAQKELTRLEGEEKMAYITSFERIGIEKGRKVASDIVLRWLKQKFGG